MLSTLLLISQLLEQIKTKTTVYETIFDRVKRDRATLEAQLAPAEVLMTPVVTEVIPSHGRAGTKITLKGRGFASQNTIQTGFGSIKASSPDGETLTFILPKPLGLPDNYRAAVADYWRQNYGDYEPTLPLGFYVQNSSGQSAGPGRFTLEF